MSKKRRQPAPPGPQKAKAGPEPGPAALQASPAEGNTGVSGGKKLALWLFSLVLIVSGYAALKKVDPSGGNGWAVAAPALLLAGYLLIIPSILATFRR